MAFLRMIFRRSIPLAAPILVGFVCCVSWAQTQAPVISVGMHYQQAHDQMTITGFQPFYVIPPHSDDYKRNFAFREDVPKRFPEAVECAPTGRSPCMFLFRRGPNEIVEITTDGEHADALIVRYVRALTLKEANGLYAE